MYRYFIEVSYKGTNYSGFQRQINAVTVENKVEEALQKIFRYHVSLTGSSRTDAGVHALQNFFHADFVTKFSIEKLYNLNAVLPTDIVIKNIYSVAEQAHCRFDAIAREYKYFIATQKNPFSQDSAYYYPYPLGFDLLQKAGEIIQMNTDFTSFSKQHTQVNNFICTIQKSTWIETSEGLIYHVKANRFLRGMVRGLVATMLQVGRGKMDIVAFEQIFAQKNHVLTDFSAPAHGLFLVSVHYPERLLTIL